MHIACTLEEEPRISLKTAQLIEEGDDSRVDDRHFAA
jgi:hypothetical protein